LIAGRFRPPKPNRNRDVISRLSIEKLAPKERAELRQWLDAQDIEESPDFLAAVDKGIWSAENEPKSSLEGVMKRLEERFGWKLK